MPGNCTAHARGGLLSPSRTPSNKYSFVAGVGALLQIREWGERMHNAWEMRWIAQGVGLMHWSEWDSADGRSEGSAWQD